MYNSQTLNAQHVLKHCWWHLSARQEFENMLGAKGLKAGHDAVLAHTHAGVHAKLRKGRNIGQPVQGLRAPPPPPPTHTHKPLQIGDTGNAVKVI